MIGFHEFTIGYPGGGGILVARSIPEDGRIWGRLDVLRDTPWGRLIPVVAGDVLSHALHGHVTPLMRQIGPQPAALLRMVPVGYRICADHKRCISFDKAKCHPSKALPECYAAPGLPPDAMAVAAFVALAWRDNRYVIVVEGHEFSL